MIDGFHVAGLKKHLFIFPDQDAALPASETPKKKKEKTPIKTFPALHLSIHSTASNRMVSSSDTKREKIKQNLRDFDNNSHKIKRLFSTQTLPFFKLVRV